MAPSKMVRDSLIVMAMVIFSTFVAASALNLVVSGGSVQDATVRLLVVALGSLAVLGLGFVLWRSEARPSGS